MPTIPTPPTNVVQDPNRRFTHWHISEIYVPGGAGRYVPNVNDLVTDYDQGFLRVVDVDYTTSVSTLQPWSAPETINDSGIDILLGPGPGYQSETFRVFIDTSVFPHTLTLDHRMQFNGSAASHIKVFLGTNISQQGTVISAFYDQSGGYLGDNIPLEVTAIQNVTNIAIKAPRPGFTTRQLPDGEVVTVVAYDDAGGIGSVAKLLVKNAKLIRRSQDPTKYISSISLKSPFLSTSDPHLLQYPINMPVLNLNLVGVIHYSDGSRLELPIDGSRFRLHGLESHVASIQGQVVPLVLSYHLGPNESAYNLAVSPSNHISVAYQASTLEADNAYTVKLFAYPSWVDQLSGYQMRYYLYNLSRDVYHDVTSKVSPVSTSAPFNPLLYGQVQTLSVGVNLSEVDGRYANYRHVQTFRVTLRRPGTEVDQDNWHVSYTPGQDPEYGVGTFATAHLLNVNQWEVNVGCGETTVAAWLAKVYSPIYPLHDPRSEVTAPTPTHVRIQSGTHSVEIPVEDFNRDILVHTAPQRGRLIVLHFVRKMAGNDLQLGAAGLITRHI